MKALQLKPADWFNTSKSFPAYFQTCFLLHRLQQESSYDGTVYYDESDPMIQDTKMTNSLSKPTVSA